MAQEGDQDARAAAELAEWQKVLKDFSRANRSLKTSVKGYTVDDVQVYDVRSGNCNVLLNQIRAKLDNYAEVIDTALDETMF